MSAPVPPPTPQQQAIIEHPPTPLRIVAGAGTGKTTSIVGRLVAAIDGGLPPEAALGVTFTNKAAEELADRLRSALPELAATGHDVEVTTYHGFAHQLLQEHGALIGVERGFQVVGPGYVRQLMYQSLAGRRYESLDLTAPMHRVNDAVMLASQLGDHLGLPEALVDMCERHDGDVWEARAELAAVVLQYERTKRQLGALDYADLIRGAYRLVTAFPSVADQVRDRYRMVLLDEYQDTAAGQRELLLAVFGSGFPVTAVGDGDQTIYEWRGASLENFAAFPTHFALADGTPAPTLPLTVNHRSTSAILDVAHAVRTTLHDDETFARLVAPPGTPTGHAGAHWFADARAEALWIGQELRRLHDEEDVAWRDMAVLFRKKRHMALVRDAAASYGVPVEVASLGGLLDVPEVADLHAWLRLLEHPDDSAALARLLLGSSFRLGLGDLAPLAAHARRRPPERSPHAEDRPLLIEAIDALSDVVGLSAEARRRLEVFHRRYRHLLVTAQGVTLDELCREILDVNDVWVEIDSMDAAAGLSSRLNLYRFLDLAREWSPLEGRTSLEAFLGYLELLADEAAGDELDTSRVGGEDAVGFLTVHRAKGLEWHTVFLPALTQGTFPARSLGYDNPERYPRYLPYELRLDASSLPVLDGGRDDQARLAERHRAAEWRTAYVAVTRAKQRLYLTGAWWYEGGKTSRRPSELFEVAQGCDAVLVGTVAPEPDEPPDRLVIEPTTGAPDPVFDDGWQLALHAATEDPSWPSRRAGELGVSYDAAVDQLRLLVADLPREPETPTVTEPAGTSVTGLVTLARCPRQFYWAEIDRLPRRPSPWRQRGVAVHRRIELHHRGILEFDEVDDERYDHLAETGTEIRSAMDVFLGSRFAEISPRDVETPIDLRIGDARVRGRIDAVYEPEPGTWEIVDFKTGRRSNDPADLVQLEAYAVAAVNGAVAEPTPQRLSVSFAYLGGGTLDVVSHDVDAAWIERAEQHLGELLTMAAGARFDPQPSERCRRCDFLAFCPEGQGAVSLDD